MSVFIEQNSTNQTFDKNSWCILNPIEQSIKEKIERIGTPLKEWDVNIYRGVLTGLNEAFIIDGAKKDELIAQDPKSAEIIRPILRGRDIQRYSYNFADKWLIATFPSKHYNIDDYPAIRDYLLTFDRRVLAQTGEKDIDGIKGKNARKKTCNKWFETQDSIAYWDDFSKQKIVYSEIVQKPQFYLDDGRFYVEATSFLLTGKNLEYLIACLNSKPVTYFFKTFYAGGGLGEKGFRYKKAFLTNLPIPKIKSIEYNNEYFKNLIDNSEIIKIDKIIYEIFDLTSEEIEYIENTINI